MKYVGVDANVMALSGIAIAIGTMVDMGIVFTENIAQRIAEAPDGEDRIRIVPRATGEVAAAVMTSVLTTVVGFLPIFGLTAAEGKLFAPLAYTKTFAIVAAFFVSVIFLPPLAHLILRSTKEVGPRRRRWVSAFQGSMVFNWLIVACGVGSCHHRPRPRRSSSPRCQPPRARDALRASAVRPFARSRPARRHCCRHHRTHGLLDAPGSGPHSLRKPDVRRLHGGDLMVLFWLFQRFYQSILARCLRHKVGFLIGNVAFVFVGATAWLGVPVVFGWLPAWVRISVPTRPPQIAPGLQEDFMPPFDEGSFLLMPTTTPHASIGQALEMMQTIDAAVAAIPEVERAVGKLGRAESPLDPAPISMFETVVNYHSEYILDEAGHIETFQYDEEAEEFVRDEHGQLIPDPAASPFASGAITFAPRMTSGRRSPKPPNTRA